MEVIFYEKPGCINNTKQKMMLLEAGHNLKIFSLLTYHWNKEELRSFFEGLPLPQWFNPTAPAIKKGEIKPDELTEDSALNAMLKDPLLIRRPLIEANGIRICGFDNPLVEELTNHTDVSHVLSCPNAAKQQNCN